MPNEFESNFPSPSNNEERSRKEEDQVLYYEGLLEDVAAQENISTSLPRPAEHYAKVATAIEDTMKQIKADTDLGEEKREELLSKFKPYLDEALKMILRS